MNTRRGKGYFDKPDVEWIKVSTQGNKWKIRDEYIDQKQQRASDRITS